MSEFFRAVIIGESSVGKSELVYSTKAFFRTGAAPNRGPLPATSTIGVNHETFKLQHLDLGPVKISLCDTPGQGKFDLVVKEQIEKHNFFICCWDITNRDSFEVLRDKWLPEIDSLCHRDEATANKVQIMILGLKADLEGDRRVTRAESNQLRKGREQRIVYQSEISSVSADYQNEFVNFVNVLKKEAVAWTYQNKGRLQGTAASVAVAVSPSAPAPLPTEPTAVEEQKQQQTEQRQQEAAQQQQREPQCFPAGKGFCFPADCLVMTTTETTTSPAALKKLEELEIGATVLGGGTMTAKAAATATTTETQLIGFGHRLPHSPLLCVVLHLECGRNLRLSGNHLLSVFVSSNSSSNSSSVLKPADEVSIGEFLLALANDKQQLQLVPSKVVRIETNVVCRGVFAPVTSSGTIIVDGVLASCYTRQVPLPALTHAAVSALNRFAGTKATAAVIENVVWLSDTLMPWRL